MKFYKISCVTDDTSQASWFFADKPSRAFGRRVFLVPDGERSSFERDDDETRYRILAATADSRHDLADLEACVLEACRDWGIEGAVRVRSIESSTYRDCFGDVMSSSSQVVRRLSQALDANEFCVLMQEVNVVEEKLVERTAPAQDAATCYGQCLAEELERIGRGPAQTAGRPFLPAHYLIEGMNAHEYGPALDVLLSSLAEAGRVPAECVVSIDLDRTCRNEKCRHSPEYFASCMNDALVESLEGEVVVIRYGLFDEGGSFAELPYRLLTSLLDALARHPHAVQTIVVVPEGADELKQRIRSRFAVPWVELRRDVAPSVQEMDPAEATALLAKRAAGEGLAPDARLEAFVHERLEDRSFSDLDGLYEEWRRAKLTCERFPSYVPVVERSTAQRLDKGTSALERLNALVGLDGVKRHVDDILARIQMNRELARAGLPARPFSMHLAFLGEPGTGKTEVARLYADILREQHVLSEGRLVVRSGAHGFCVDDAFKAARGSVLFIDEAYGLIDCPSMVESLIANMENHRDETVVILAGYEDDMERLFRTNPGFRSRVGFQLRFPGYSDEEKLEIFQLMARRAHLAVPPETLARVRDLLARGGRRDDEGNARFVRKLFEDACGRQQARLARSAPAEGYTEEALSLLLPDDVGKVAARPAKSGRDELADLVGLAEVKKLVGARLDLMRAQKARRDAGVAAPFVPLHLAFKGNPGTGKTEVARLVGRILKEEGVLSVGDFYECGRQDLVAPFVGGTAPKVEALFRRAKGSVIFIDEAYALNDGQRGGYGDEAITAIIDQMEKLREDVVVIFAGYSREIDELLAANPGFASRVRTQVEFADYGVDELVEVLRLMARKQGLVLGDGVEEHVRALFAQAAARPNFGNARYARNLLEEALVGQGMRLAAEAADEGRDMGELPVERLVTLAPEDFSDAGAGEGAPCAVGFLAA